MTDIDPAAYRAAADALAEACAVPDTGSCTDASNIAHAAYEAAPVEQAALRSVLGSIPGWRGWHYGPDGWRLLVQAVRLRLLVEVWYAETRELSGYDPRYDDLDVVVDGWMREVARVP